VFQVKTTAALTTAGGKVPEEHPGKIRWVRAQAVGTDAAVQLGFQGHWFTLSALVGYVAPTNAPWDGIRVRGDVTLDVSADGREPYPGPAGT
jgi:hypothetical protein